MNELQKFKDQIAEDAFGMNKGDALEKHICISCRKEPRFYSRAGRKEYAISGLCEFCFDVTCLGRQEAEEYWRDSGIPEGDWPEEEEEQHG